MRQQIIFLLTVRTVIHPQIPWREIIGMRNRIVHAYFDVDLNVIWQVIKSDLPELLRWVNQAIQDLIRPLAKMFRGIMKGYSFNK